MRRDEFRNHNADLRSVRDRNVEVMPGVHPCKLGFLHGCLKGSVMATPDCRAWSATWGTAVFALHGEGAIALQMRPQHLPEVESVRLGYSGWRLYSDHGAHEGFGA